MIPGHTYFRRWGFSINEGEIPNIHLSWRGGVYFYVCWGANRRWCWMSPRRRMARP